MAANPDLLIGFSLLGFSVWSTTRPGAVAIPTKEKVPAPEQPLHMERDGNPLADQTFWTEGSLAESVTVSQRQP